MGAQIYTYLLDTPETVCWIYLFFVHKQCIEYGVADINELP